MTLDDLIEFAIPTDYINQRGKKRYSLSIDRIDDELGYTRGNLRALTLSDNSKKENARRRLIKRGEWNPEAKRMEFWNTYFEPEPANALDDWLNEISQPQPAQQTADVCFDVDF